MIKSNEIQSPSSCLNSAASDEPIFVLRANDELASDIVREWARRYALSKLIINSSLAMTGLQIYQHHKYDEALELADQMDRWRLK